MQLLARYIKKYLIHAWVIHAPRARQAAGAGGVCSQNGMRVSGELDARGKPKEVRAYLVRCPVKNRESGRVWIEVAMTKQVEVDGGGWQWRSKGEAGRG